MRRIVYFQSMSLDGFMEGPNREIDWHRVDDEFHEHMNERLGAMSAFLQGRVVHALMADYWPTADADPASGGPMVEFAGIWRDMPKIVFSRTWENTDWNTTIKREVVAEEIRALKAEPGGDMVVGGANLADTFRRLGLIDEYAMYVHPVLIGRGKPAFRPTDETTDGTTGLELVESRVFGNGVALLRYRVG
ncbi:dihydrofolate reductase family protein [Embleya sp. MST-111070]|uniref:dihydrofolate reductase family protein n=1 Tax=Embleya sp. MST-111070 TaxID=3398231 RepID=UPI003F731621